MMMAFNEGEYLFEKEYNTNTEGAFHGLGPVYVRRGCLYCHPGYGHGARQTEYKADNHRNGYLLVVYDKTTNAYIRSVAGMQSSLSRRLSTRIRSRLRGTTTPTNGAISSLMVKPTRLSILR